MTIIAILLAIALIGFVAAIIYIIAVAASFKRVPVRINTIIAPPRDSLTVLINTGKGLFEVGKVRYQGYVKHGTRIVDSVKSTAEEVGAAAKSVDVGEAKSTFQSVASSINAAQEGLAAAKAVLDILSRSEKSG